MLEIFLLAELLFARFSRLGKGAGYSNVAILAGSAGLVVASNSIAPKFSLASSFSEKTRRIALLFRLFLLRRFRFPLSHFESKSASLSEWGSTNN